MFMSRMDNGLHNYMNSVVSFELCGNEGRFLYMVMSLIPIDKFSLILVLSTLI